MTDTQAQPKPRRAALTINVEQAFNDLRGLCKKYKVSTSALDLFEATTMSEAKVQPPQGRPGTRTSSGDILAEPNPLWSPYRVRGSWGVPGEYEKIWRGEPKVFDAVQTYTEAIVTGHWQVTLHKEAPEELKLALAEWMAAQTRELKNIASGWTTFLEHAMTFLIFGFAPFEVIWAFDEGGERTIFDLQYREVSTVDRWLFDLGMSQVIGAGFSPYSGLSYELYLGDEGAGDVELDDELRWRMIVCNLNAHGLNIEGVPPTRPSLFYVTLKQLVAQIVGVSAERYGVPVNYLYEEPAAIAAFDGQTDSQELRDVYDAIANADAIEGLFITLPGAVRIGQTAQTGTMPDFKAIFDYCDLQISAPFSNEGSLVGLQGSVGSYALGEVKEREVLKSAPYYARKVAEPINKVIKLMAFEAFGELEIYPELTWSPGLVEDATRWINDALAIFGGPISTWPKEAQRVGLELLNLDGSILAVEEELAGDGVSETAQAGSLQDSALNGAQIASMVNVIQAMNTRAISRESAIEIIMRSFLMSREDAARLVGPELPPAPQPAAPMQDHALIDPRSTASFAMYEHGHTHNLADDIAEVVEDERAVAMDGVEVELTAAFAKLQREMQAAWRIAVRDNETADDVLKDREELRAQFLPRYIEAVRAALDAARQAGQSSLVSELDLEPSTDFNELLLDLSKELQLLTVAVSEEAFNRALGVMTAASVGQAGGDRRRSVPLLAPSTLAKIASRPVSTAFNAGREDIAAQLAGQVGKLTATYSSVLDRKTCKVCAELDGRAVEYGSKTYRDLSPPHKCLGGDRCRCIWIYSSPALSQRVGVIE